MRAARRPIGGARVTRRVENLPPAIVRGVENAAVARPGTRCDLDTLTKLHVEETYIRHKGNKARTARALGIGRRSLYRLLEKFEIDYLPSDAETAKH